MKTGLPIKTINDIRVRWPCYDPTRYAPEDWQGTALDILRAEQVPVRDRLWVVLDDRWMDERILRRFALWCATKECQKVENPSWGNLAVLRTIERYIEGNATKQELLRARDVARKVANRAKSNVAKDAVWAAYFASYIDAGCGAACVSMWVKDFEAQIEYLIKLLEEQYG